MKIAYREKRTSPYSLLKVDDESLIRSTNQNHNDEALIEPVAAVSRVASEDKQMGINSL